VCLYVIMQYSDTAATEYNNDNDDDDDDDDSLLNAHHSLVSCCSFSRLSLLFLFQLVSVSVI